MSIGVIAILLSLLLPGLSSARGAARQGVCLSNLRQAYVACRMYADDHAGLGPAIGQPYVSLPFWALVVQDGYAPSHKPGTKAYSTRSVLVCPGVDGAYPERMTRTYAMNATGHAGLTPPDAPPDPDDYDEIGTTAHIALDLVPAPSLAVLLVDSAVAFIPDGAPPPTQTSSVIDFRQPGHVASRLGRFHAGSFDGAMLDGSARPWGEVPERWLEPLP